MRNRSPNYEDRPLIDYYLTFYGNTSILIANQFSGRGRYSKYFNFVFSQDTTTSQVVFHFEVDEPLPNSGNIGITSTHWKQDPSWAGIVEPMGGELRLLDWTTGKSRNSNGDPNSLSEQVRERATFDVCCNPF